MALDSPRNVEDLLNYRLARLMALTGAPGLRLLEGRYGVTRRAWGLMGILAANGAMSPSELSQRARLERAKVSLTISDLVERGLLLRVAVPHDRRRAHVDLTEQGRALYRQAFPEVAAISQSMLEDLSPAQIEALDQIMRRISATAERLQASALVTDKADRRRGGSRRIRG